MDDIDLQLLTVPQLRNRRERAEQIAAAFEESGQSDRAAWWFRRANMYAREIVRRSATTAANSTQEA